jgi:NTP pyrophosphatase (non-canonical NTP hydrolase)
MSEWKERIKQWAADRNLIEGSTPRKQMDKLNEECSELYEGILDNDSDDIKDAIGDIQVVLAVMCCQLGVDIDECREIAWEEIKDRKGKMVDGVFVKESQA